MARSLPKQAKAERIIQQTLRTEGISEEQLAQLRKGHAFKARWLPNCAPRQP
jgi:hypothetical protein